MCAEAAKQESFTARLKVRQLGLADYAIVVKAMQDFTAQRDSSTQDEIWFVEHAPVFTLGLNSKSEHLLNTGDIPVIQSDRGGQVTYHGPGQLVMYVLLDIKRLGISVQQLVHYLEAIVIKWLSTYAVIAEARADAPGVYVKGAKLASLGLRIKHGCSYHGLSLNIDMDTEPFSRINPCGLADTPVCQLTDLGIHVSTTEAAQGLQAHLVEILGYTVEPD
ncbi:MAG: lipoyl(octanoyl) transferase LipB [Gammaproteobacteria bacterium]